MYNYENIYNKELKKVVKDPENIRLLEEYVKSFIIYSVSNRSYSPLAVGIYEEMANLAKYNNYNVVLNNMYPVVKSIQNKFKLANFSEIYNVVIESFNSGFKDSDFIEIRVYSLYNTSSPIIVFRFLYKTNELVFYNTFYSPMLPDFSKLATLKELAFYCYQSSKLLYSN